MHNKKELIMHKKLGITLILCLVSTFCYAQVPRGSDSSQTGAGTAGFTSDQGISTFTNIAVTGLDATSNPSYVVFFAPDEIGNMAAYYLYVDDTGDLRLASQPDLDAFASFPTGNWRTNNMSVGVVVGSQS